MVNLQLGLPLSHLAKWLAKLAKWLASIGNHDPKPKLSKIIFDQNATEK
jgi:hypothetical protein